MARYGLFVLKVPLNPNQPTNPHLVGWEGDTPFHFLPVDALGPRFNEPATKFLL